MDKIQYRELDTYKYEVTRAYRINIGITGHELLNHRYLQLTPEGWLTIFSGYCWNGANKPAINTLSTRRGSLVHDACYQLIRMGILPPLCRILADALLRKILVEDGMWRIRAWWWYRGVRLGGEPCIEPTTEQQDVYLEAP